MASHTDGVSPQSPPLDQGHFTTLEPVPESTAPFSPDSITQETAAVDSIEPAPAQDHSTLEYVPPAEARSSTYKPAHYGHSRGPSDNSLPPYTQDAGRFSTLPEAYHAPQDEQHATEDTEANKENVAGGFMQRRVCGLEMKAVLIIAIILLVAIIGGVVGGVVGTRKNSNATAAPDPAATAGSATPGENTSSSSTSAAPSSSSSSSSTTTSTQSQMPFIPMSTSDPGYLPPSSNFFSSLHYYRILNPNHTSPSSSDDDTLPSSIEASYDPDIGEGSITMGTGEVATNTFDQWQFRPVPYNWRNSTYKMESDVFPQNTFTRLYWMSSRAYGPDVRLALNDWDQNWKDVLRNRNSSLVYPSLQLRPKDVDDPGQYWFFIQVNATASGLSVPTGADVVWTLYNWKGRESFRLFHDAARLTNPPKLGSEETWPELDDLWDIRELAEVGKNDGGFNWITQDGG